MLFLENSRLGRKDISIKPFNLLHVLTVPATSAPVRSYSLTGSGIKKILRTRLDTSVNALDCLSAWQAYEKIENALVVALSNLFLMFVTLRVTKYFIIWCLFFLT